MLAVPTQISEVRLFEIDNGTMSQARLAREVWDYERYAGHRAWEGARGTAACSPVNPLGVWRRSMRPVPRRGWLGTRVRSRSGS
ncbi:replication-relaxation family protein [Streptomyces europaeiscabiei]|uniref:replication-relaxation family protein n=1 Tax=Streptomyces europaeiscabiei TaxID=146819 RepID=UPI0038F74F55